MKTNTPIHILIIEDSPDDCADIRRMLLLGSDRHYRFTEAEKGAAGVLACREANGGPPDCVVLDYYLPDMDALEVLAELRGGSELPVCPIVVLTGSDVRVGRSVLRAGAQDYIGKSWSTPESLTRAVENAIERFELVSERSSTERKLRESEERIRLAAQISGFGIYDYDVAADTCNWSPELFSLTGIPGHTVIRMETITGMMHPEDRERFRREMKTALDPRGTGEFVDEFRVVRADTGETRWHHNRGQTMFKSSNGERSPVRHTGIVIDVTDRKRAAAELSEAKQAAEVANQSKDRFLAMLSHELRSPLTPVLMAAAALEADSELRPDVREHLAMIKRNIAFQTKLIDDLLDLTRITNSKVELDIQTVDLNQTVLHVSESCRSQMREKGIRFETELFHAAELIAADPIRLQQVLRNVLMNAVKFTPENGTIRVATARQPGGHWEIRVRDSGIGISAEALPRIFDAFEQGDVSVTRRFGGLGLGLAICKALVDLHRGSIRAESAGPGQGSTFIVELPALETNTVGEAPRSAPVENGKQPQMRLLLVEDHLDTAQTISRLLRFTGFTVTVVSDVASASAAAEAQPFDVVVCDLGLPDGDGCELMRRIRAIRSVPGIAMSGYGMNEDRRRSREAGFDEHLVKPVDVPQLIAAIHRVTGKPADVEPR